MFVSSDFFAAFIPTREKRKGLKGVSSFFFLTVKLYADAVARHRR